MVLMVSGVGGKGTSRMTLSGGKALGPDGAKLLADVLSRDKALPALLTSLNLRCLHGSLTHGRV